MNPWILYTDAFQLPTYFTSLMVGFALATFVLRREALRDAADPAETMTAALWALPAALVGARAAHVLVVAPAYYWANPLDVFSPVGGWVFYGGALLGLFAIVAWARAGGRDPWALLDRFAPATALGLIFGRLGCMGGGCCFGRPADWPFGVEVPWSVLYLRRGQLPEELLAVPLHPAPVYEMLLAFALFLGLSALRARQRFSGQAFLAFLLLYGVGRSVVELFRADFTRGMFFGGALSTSQIVGLSTAALALALWRQRSR